MRPFASILGLSLLLSAVAVLPTACENRSADDSSLRVEPQAIGIRINEAIDFNASGGFSYDWSLSDDTLGVLTTKKGSTTRYISRSAPEAGTGPMVQRLTVTSMVGGHGGGSGAGTNATDLGTGFIETAEAVIEHLPSPTGGGDGDGDGDGTATTTTTTTTTVAVATTTLGAVTTTTTLGAVTTTPTTTAPFFPPLP